MSAVMITAEDALRILLSVKDPLILMHTRPDGDTVGTAAALTEVYRALGVHARAACADPIPERLGFLAEGLDLTDDFTGLTPIAVDVPAAVQLGSLADKIGVDRIVLTVDHHARCERFSPTYARTEASAAAEVLFDLVAILIEEGTISLSPAIAQYLFAAISSDTGCFMFSSAGARTHRVAAELIDTGIDFAGINHLLFESKSPEQIAAEGLAAKNLRFAEGGKIAYTLIPRDERVALSLTPDAFETAIDVVRAVRGVDISFTVRENDDGTFRVSLRSQGADVAKIAAKFGGGGHIRASGCTVEAADARGAAQMILSALAGEGI